MPRGAPDWGEYAQQDLLVKTFDLGELAARLGCPSILERGGTVVFMDNFQDGYSRWVRTAQNNCQIVLSHRKTFAGGYSVRFAYSGQSTSYSLIKASVPYLYTSVYGIESLILLDDSNISLYIGISVVINGTVLTFRFKILPSSNSLYVTTPSGDQLISNSVYIDTSGNLWTFFKLIVNVENSTYLRLKINEKSYDLSVYAPSSGSSSEKNNVAMLIQAANNGTSACNLYVGSAIITVNEI